MAKTGKYIHRIELQPADTPAIGTAYAEPMTGSIYATIPRPPGNDGQLTWKGHLGGIFFNAQQSTGTSTSITFQVTTESPDNVVVPETTLTLAPTQGVTNRVHAAARIDVPVVVKADTLFVYAKVNSGDVTPTDFDCFITWSE
jgi:hypothetical protein